MQVVRWQGEAPPGEHILRERMQQEGLSPYAWSNGPHEQYSVHSHSYEKVLYCVQGSIRFVLPDAPNATKTSDATKYIDLAPGDCLVLPAGVRHSAQVGPQGVTCLEAARHRQGYIKEKASPSQ